MRQDLTVLMSELLTSATFERIETTPAQDACNLGCAHQLVCSRITRIYRGIISDYATPTDAWDAAREIYANSSFLSDYYARLERAER